MSNPNYTLEVISHHPTFKNKSLRKYYVDGIDTVGAWGDEPFEIIFKNNTWQKIQVKLTIDGTDILSGELATTDVTKDMWVVNGYGTLSLKAWPETHNGGAALVFTSANNSVAVHTHGDLSARGIIAAAVFTEGHVEPTRINYTPAVHHYHHHDSRRYDVYPVYPTYPIWSSGDFTLSSGTLGGSSGSISVQNCSFNGTSNSLNMCDAPAAASASAGNITRSLESLAAVGAGQHVNQKIVEVAGLIKPVFTETVRVRYMWWDELVSKLRANNVPMPHASGFPGDAKKTNINLGSTPRIGNFDQAFPRNTSVQSYMRV